MTRKRAAPQRVAQRFRRMQHVGLAHDRGHLAEQALLLLRHLLHVVAFAEGRLVAVDVIDADAVRRGRQRTGEGLHRARTDRGHDRGDFAVLPAQRGGGVRHLHFVAAIDGAGYAFFLVDAQHFAEIGRAVAEDGEILAHALLEQTEHQRFGQRAFDQLRQSAFGQRLLRCRRPWRWRGHARALRLRCRCALSISCVFSAAALRIGFQRAISDLSRLANMAGPRSALAGTVPPSSSEPLDDGRIVERLVERVAELVDNGFRRVLRREDRAPDVDLVIVAPTSLAEGTSGNAGERAFPRHAHRP